MTQSNRIIKVISRYQRGKVTMYQISTVLDKKSSTSHIREEQLANLEDQETRGLCRVEFLCMKHPIQVVSPLNKI